MSSYDKAEGVGTLRFKGDGETKHKKRSKKEKKEKKKKKEKGDRKRSRHDDGDAKGGGAGPSQPPQEELKILVGTGRFLSSGTTVQGVGTAFQTELRAGDAIIVRHPTTLSEETRIVTMVLSSISLSLSSPFSTDLISATAFS